MKDKAELWYKARHYLDLNRAELEEIGKYIKKECIDERMVEIGFAVLCPPNNSKFDKNQKAYVLGTIARSGIDEVSNERFYDLLRTMLYIPKTALNRDVKKFILKASQSSWSPTRINCAFLLSRLIPGIHWRAGENALKQLSEDQNIKVRNNAKV